MDGIQRRGKRRLDEKKQTRCMEQYVTRWTWKKKGVLPLERENVWDCTGVIHADGSVD